MANVLKMGGGTNELKVLKNWDRVFRKKGKKNRGPFCHLTNTFVDLCRRVWLILLVYSGLHKKTDDIRLMNKCLTPLCVVMILS